MDLLHCGRLLWRDLLHCGCCGGMLRRHCRGWAGDQVALQGQHAPPVHHGRAAARARAQAGFRAVTTGSPPLAVPPGSAPAPHGPACSPCPRAMSVASGGPAAPDALELLLVRLGAVTRRGGRARRLGAGEEIGENLKGGSLEYYMDDEASRGMVRVTAMVANAVDVAIWWGWKAGRRWNCGADAAIERT